MKIKFPEKNLPFKKQNVAAVILAAGFSTRFGADKRFAGSPPLIIKTINTIAPFFNTVIVIHRTNDPEMRALLSPLPISLVPVKGNSCSLGASISDGVQHIINIKDITHCALFLADMPYIQGPTIEHILSKIDNNIVRPQFQGKPGHPVVFARRFFEHLGDLTSLTGAKTVINAHRDCLICVPTEDPGVLLDIDYPEDLSSDLKMQGC